MSDSKADAAPLVEHLQLAERLSIPIAPDLSDDEVVATIEQVLGSRKLEVLAQWYLWSVLLHLREETAAGGAEPPAVLQPLAVALLADPGSRGSLTAVLRQRALRYRRLRFATQADPSAGIVATGSKVYQAAREALTTSDLWAPGQTLVGRRARRQQAPAARAADTATAQPPTVPTRRDTAPPVPLSAESFERLEQAMQRPVDPLQARRAADPATGQGLSLLAGVVCGALVYLLVRWLFLT